jgi:cytochrome c556
MPIALIVIAVVFAADGNLSVNAHEGATGIVKERMESMKTLGDHAKIVGNMFKGKQPFELSAVQTAAATFVTHGQKIPTLFPDTEASRRGGNTEALPAIWSDWEAFSTLAERFTSESQLLVDITESLEENVKLGDKNVRKVRTAFFRAAKGCRQCHKKFRIDRD